MLLGVKFKELRKVVLLQRPLQLTAKLNLGGGHQ